MAMDQRCRRPRTCCDQVSRYLSYANNEMAKTSGRAKRMRSPVDSAQGFLTLVAPWLRLGL